MKVHAVEPVDGDVAHMAKRVVELWSGRPVQVITKSLVVNDLARLGYAGHVIVEYVDEVLLYLGKDGAQIA